MFCTRLVGRIEKELPDKKSEFYSELRQTRHQLVLPRAEAQTQVGSADQMQMVLTNARRENKIMTEEEVHGSELLAEVSQMGNQQLLTESEGSGDVMAQLQSQLNQLQSNDTVLKARYQHDATVRFLLDRHKGEMVSMSMYADHANTRGSRLEQKKAVISEKLSYTVAGRRWL
jgi:hypothetical protein